MGLRVGLSPPTHTHPFPLNKLHPVLRHPAMAPTWIVGPSARGSE